ncbi:MAG TPA: ribosome biogenesis GTPase Der, partial [Deltaproteobacteria bacterium]|nr:ribosome biogenesis GTPase Der [Deltaproteobacteria bacterium]
DTMPPRFKVFTNFPNAIPDTYTRYLSTGIKKGLGLEGIPIAISFQKRNR